MIEEEIVKDVIMDFDYVCMFLVPLTLVVGIAAAKMLTIMGFVFFKRGKTK